MTKELLNHDFSDTSVSVVMQLMLVIVGSLHICEIYRIGLKTNKQHSILVSSRSRGYLQGI